MADFKAMMAAKKAAAAGSPTGQEPVPTAVVPTPIVQTVPEPVKPEPPVIQAEKPKTFAEILAAKKLAGAAQVVAPTPAPTAAPAPVPSAVAESESTELAQHYADIKGKIELLESLEDTQLEGAMSDLKKALMANPNAVSLMLDTDYGKMVIALRRITREAIIEAAKEKVSKKATKKEPKLADLSPDMIAAVFDEL